MEKVEYSQVDVWLGRKPETTADTIAADQVVVQFAPLGRVKATGQLKVWNPDASDGTEKAMRLVPFDIDATGAALDKEFIYLGNISIDAVAWPDGTTDIQKAGAFDGSQIVLGKLA